MTTTPYLFNNLFNRIYSLPLDERLEIKNLLEHNIAESRRSEILKNCKKSKEEYRGKKIKFSSEINELKKLL